jgi:tetratricopeptide (TPR) repeat protein
VQQMFHHRTLEVFGAVLGLTLCFFVAEPAAKELNCYNATGQTAVALCSKIVDNPQFDANERRGALRLRAKINDKLGNWQEVISDVTQLEKLGFVGVLPFQLSAKANRKLNKPELAAEDYRKAYEIEPLNEEVLNDLAWALFDLNKLEEAEKVTSTYIDRVPNSALVFYDRGWVRYTEGWFELAIKDYKSALALPRLNLKLAARLHNNLGLAYAKLGKSKRALDEYAEAIKFNPNHRYVYENRGDLYSDLGRYDDALIDYNRHLRIDYSAATLGNKAETLISLGRLKEAEIVIASAMRATDSSAATYVTLGKLKRFQGNFAEAEERYQFALKFDHNHFWARYWLAELHFSQSKYDSAVEEFSQLVSERPKLASTHNYLGLSLLLSGRAEASLPHFLNASRFDTKSSGMYENLAIAHSQLRRWDESLHFANLALVRNAKSSTAYSRRAYAYWWLGNLVAALVDYDRAVELDPTSQIVRSERGLFHMENGNYEKALLDYDFLVSANRSAENLTNKAKALTLLNRESEALVVLSLASRAPKNSVIVAQNIEAMLRQNGVNQISAYAAEIQIGILEGLKLDALVIKKLDAIIKNGTATSRHFEKRGDLLFKLGRKDEALSDYKKMLGWSRNQLTLNRVANTLVELSRYDEAEIILSEAVKQPDVLAGSLVLYGRVMQAKRNFTMADESYIRALKLEPTLDIARYWIASSMLEQGRFKEASVLYENLQAVWPGNVRVQLDLGHALYEQARHTDALRHFTLAIDSDPKSGEGLENRALTNIQLGKFQDAIKDATLAIELDDRSWVAYARRANAQWKLYKLNAALADYNKAIELKPNIRWLLEERSDFHIANLMLELALKDADAALKLDDVRGSTFRTRALAAELLGRYSEALEYYTKALSSKDANDWLLEDRSWAYIGLGQPLKAIEDCELLIKRQPTKADGFHCRSNVYLSLANTRAQSTDLDLALKLEPGHMPSHYDFGHVKLADQSWEGAELEFNTTIKAGYRVPESYYFRGVAKEELGQWKGAMKDYEISLGYEKNRWAKQISARLEGLKRKQPLVGAINSFEYPQRRSRSGRYAAPMRQAAP